MLYTFKVKQVKEIIDYKSQDKDQKEANVFTHVNYFEQKCSFLGH